MTGLVWEPVVSKMCLQRVLAGSGVRLVPRCCEPQGRVGWAHGESLESICEVSRRYVA
jgi:hypothetical protein